MLPIRGTFGGIAGCFYCIGSRHSLSIAGKRLFRLAKLGKLFGKKRRRVA
jgi:hypothetical protein